MQFESPHENEAWPDDMSIRVSDGSNLLELLWLRHQAVANAEPSLPAAALPGDPIKSPDNRLVGLWEKSWKDALEHSRRLQETDPLAIPDHTDLWTPPDIAPFAAELGLDASDTDASWRRTLTFHDAERLAVASLRGAWERGLRVVLEVPLGGPYARELSTATLLISSVTRRDVVGYSEALDSFGRR
jgi:hypothetical protein